MKQLVLKKSSTTVKKNFIEEYLHSCDTIDSFVSAVREQIDEENIKFYDDIGDIIDLAGLHGIKVTRSGDVNNRFDAQIIDVKYSIPIEIKSPREDKEINLKSITQALENKIVLTSRKSFNSTLDTTSLAIALNYPAARSDVRELVKDIKKVYGFNIGMISLDHLLCLAYDVNKNNCHLNFEYLRTLYGPLNYEKIIVKE